MEVGKSVIVWNSGFQTGPPSIKQSVNHVQSFAFLLWVQPYQKTHLSQTSQVWHLQQQAQAKQALLKERKKAARVKKDPRAGVTVVSLNMSMISSC